MSNPANNLKNKSVIWISAVLFLLALFSSIYIAYSNFKTTQQAVIEEREKKAAHLQSLMKDIGKITLSQIENSLNMEIGISGPSSDQYILEVDVSASSFMSVVLKSYRQPIQLAYPYQDFNFRISFDEMAQLYREKLENYVLNFDKPIDINEVIAIEVRLILIGTPGYDTQEIEKLPLQPKYSLALGEFVFSCHKDSCKVNQLLSESK